MTSLSATERLAPTGGYVGLREVGETRTTLSQQVGTIRQQVRHLDGDTRDLHRRAWEDDLSQSCQLLGRQRPADLLGRLNEWGFAWRDVARLTGVSVPALQKWRRGENITGENRLKLAYVVAVVEKIEQEMLVNDPASWFEMPVARGVAVSPIDLVAAGKAHLVLDLASNHSAVDEALDAFDPDWRERYVDPAFETYVANDGMVSIRPKD